MIETWELTKLRKEARTTTWEETWLVYFMQRRIVPIPGATAKKKSVVNWDWWGMSLIRQDSEKFVM